MLDRLPSEILLDILLLTLPTSNAYSTYRTRQDLLLSYSLVSRQVCRVAQPLLERVFRPKKALAAILKKSPGLAQNVRVLQVYNEVPSFDSVFREMGKMTNLEEVRMEKYRKDMMRKELTALGGLHTLVLISAKLTGWSSVVFTNLVSLTIKQIEMKPHGDAEVLSAASLPSLRALCLGTFETTAVQAALYKRFVDLSSQLDMLQVEYSTYHTYPSNLCHHGVPVLSTMSLYEFRRSANPPSIHSEHRQLNALSDWPPAPPNQFALFMNLPSPLVSLIDVVAAQKGRLKTLVLPLDMHPDDPTPLPTDVSTARKQLLSTCEDGDVKVIWRFAGDASDDVGVSKEFWEYAKELKRKRGEAGDVA